jgi:hypothetical protein
MKPITNEHRRSGLLGLAVSAALLTTAGAARADAPKPPGQDCFSITQWHGWSAPSDKVIYLGVNQHDIYRVDLSSGSVLLRSPDVHLVSRIHGPNTICSALDLQLEVSDDNGFHEGLGARGLGGGFRGGGGSGMSEPLIAAKLTKLTPGEVAAIPRKDRPN